jgi:hypothetical protein
MSKVFNGRYTAATDQPFVVFIIGMRINRIWAVHKWLPVASAMGPMLSSLYRHPEKGFLDGMLMLGDRGPVMIQYWRSFEDLERFARGSEDPHLGAWKRFNQAVGGDGSVGIWHETYLVNPGEYETLYGNMPRMGLAKAVQHVPAVGRRHTARTRLETGGEHELVVPASETMIASEPAP